MLKTAHIKHREVRVRFNQKEVNAMKLSAWLFTLVGVVYTLPLLGINVLSAKMSMWLVALSFLVMGINKLMNTPMKGRKR